MNSPTLNRPLFIQVEEQSRSIRRDERISIRLTRTEFRIMSYLVNQYPRPISKHELTSYVWNNLAVNPQAIDSHLHKLRRKLRDLEITLSYVKPGHLCITVVQ